MKLQINDRVIFRVEFGPFPEFQKGNQGRVKRFHRHGESVLVETPNGCRSWINPRYLRRVPPLIQLAEESVAEESP